MRTAFTIALLSALYTGTAPAQGGGTDPNCVLNFSSCQAKVDLLDYLAPQVGTLVAGGNPTLGQGGTLNGFGHATAALRVKAVHGSLPDFRNYDPPAFSTGPTKFPTKAAWIPLPVAEAAIGLYAGWPLGVTRVGGIDLIGDASWLPEFSGGSTGLELPNGGLVTGYGARIGLLQEGLLTPGVGVTWERHELPTMAIHGSAAATTLRIDDIDMTATSWRVTANKSLIAFGVATGIGQDRYRSAAVINKTNGPSTSGPFRVAQEVNRLSWFGDLSMNVFLAKLVAEIGGVSGGDIKTYNSFAGKAPDAFRLYGSLGLRIGI